MLKSLCTFSLLLVSLAAHPELRAGAAKASIVPPFPVHMGGFGDRMKHFEGVHDDLFARALVLENDELAVIFVATDLMALDKKLVEQARAKITKETSVPREHILISCAHNHSAPSYYQFEEDADQQKTRDFFAEQFAAAAIEAWEARRPARIGYANGEVKGATRNRQQGNETVIDTQLGVLRVEEPETRAVIATLFNFTGHPVILGSDNLQLSGEFPGAASRTVEQVLGGVALFTQGACGDITVHRSGDPWLEIERLGRLIGGEVIATAESI
ncbi:MAG: neutral/alkaline non-lysosomal ceramidase N-terminal domain-containing protein, partial [Candidatus Hydrogenedentales bacterium]